MCTRLVNKTSHNSVKSLLTICLEYIMLHVDAYSTFLPFVPVHIKNRIVKRLTLTTNETNIKDKLEMLVNSQLKEIDFSLNETDDELLKTISCCHNLRELILTRTKNDILTSTGLIEVMPNLKNLRVLQAPNCSAITDSVIKVIVNSSQYLSGLDISGCRNVTDTSLMTIKQLTKLIALNMCRTNITNDGIIELVEGCSGSVLKELRISECNGVTHKAINVISEKCTALEVFIFNNCTQVNGQNCVNFENANFKKLKQLTWTVYW